MTVPSIKAMADPMMVAARIQGPDHGAHGASARLECMTPTSHGGLPMLAKTPVLSAASASFCRSERGAFRCKEHSLLWGRLAAQDLVPVREAPEPLDYVPVPHGVGDHVGRALLAG